MVDSTTLVEEIRLILERELPDPWQDATKNYVIIIFIQTM